MWTRLRGWFVSVWAFIYRENLVKLAILILVVIGGGTLGFSLFETLPPANALWWTIVTVTTVGYGDIAPQTIAGQVLAALCMILGYSIIIVPIGIFSVELFGAPKSEPTTQSCPHCLKEGHDHDATFCKYCGGKL